MSTKKFKDIDDLLAKYLYQSMPKYEYLHFYKQECDKYTDIHGKPVAVVEDVFSKSGYSGHKYGRWDSHPYVRITQKHLYSEYYSDVYEPPNDGWIAVNYDIPYTSMKIVELEPGITKTPGHMVLYYLGDKLVKCVVIDKHIYP